MARWNQSRLSALAGVAATVLYLVGNLVGGPSPAFNASAGEIASHFTRHNHAVLVSVLLTGIAAPLLAWLLVALALGLRNLGERGLGVVGGALGLGAVVLATVADALYGSLARIGEEGDARLAKAVYQVGGFMTVKAFWFAAGLTLAIAFAARRVLPRWYAITSAAATILLLMGGLSVGRNGFFAPLRGGTAPIAFLALLVWVLATSGVVFGLSQGPQPDHAESPMTRI
jgi:hypothetical protein